MPASLTGRTRTALFTGYGSITHDPPVWSIEQDGVARDWESPIEYRAGVSEPDWAERLGGGIITIDWNGGAEIGLLNRLFRVGVRTNSVIVPYTSPGGEATADRTGTTFSILEHAAGSTPGTQKTRLRVLLNYFLYGVDDAGYHLAGDLQTSGWSSDYDPLTTAGHLIWQPSQGNFSVAFEVELREVVESGQVYEEYRIVDLTMQAQFTPRFTFLDIDFSPAMATVFRSRSAETTWYRLGADWAHRKIRFFGLGPTIPLIGSAYCSDANLMSGAGDALGVTRGLTELSGSWDTQTLTWLGNTDTDWIAYPAFSGATAEAIARTVIRAPGSFAEIGPDWAMEIRPNTRNYLDGLVMPVTVQHDVTSAYRDGAGDPQTDASSDTWSSEDGTGSVNPRRVPTTGYLQYARATVDGGRVYQPGSHA